MQPVEWYQYFRDICSWKMLVTVVGRCSPGSVVQINESVMVKAKYHLGHQLGEPPCWVFGINDPAKNEGYIELVQHRDAGMLLPIIRLYIPVGMEIWSGNVGQHMQSLHSATLTGPSITPGILRIWRLVYKPHGGLL